MDRFALTQPLHWVMLDERAPERKGKIRGVDEVDTIDFLQFWPRGTFVTCKKFLVECMDLVA